MRILYPENPRFPPEGSSAEGKSGPKARLKSVVDGQRVNIPVPFFIYDSASFSWKYDIHYFDALASRIHVSTQSVFAASQHLERLNR